eukprot:208831-Rhodomonas_salina.2
MGESPAGKGPVWLPAERVKGFAGREHMEVPSKKRRGVVATKGALSDSPYAPSPTRHPLDPTSMSPALPQGGKISTCAHLLLAPTFDKEDPAFQALNRAVFVPACVLCGHRANVKSALDWELYRTYGLPGPGSYECTGKVMGSIDREPGQSTCVPATGNQMRETSSCRRRLPAGRSIDIYARTDIGPVLEQGITLSKGKRQSTLDTVMRLAGRLPGDVLCIPAPLAYLVSRFYSEQAYPGRSASRDGRATARVQRL